MTDKEKVIKKLKEALDSLDITSDLRLVLIQTIEYLQEEPVSEFMNTESMIESYKQRLISQPNGVKNSPLIDMCLASYKHGINETLDTLNLSNVQRTLKNWEKPKFKVGDRIKFKGIHNEDVIRVITDIKEGEGVGFRYFFADGSIYPIGDDGVELVEEPVCKDLEEAIGQSFIYHENRGDDFRSDKQIETAYRYGFETGAKWQKEKDLELGSEDIRTILNIENDILSECNSHKELVIETYPKGEDYYGEILKRFKEMKDK